MKMVAPFLAFFARSGIFDRASRSAPVPASQIRSEFRRKIRIALPRLSKLLCRRGPDPIKFMTGIIPDHASTRQCNLAGAHHAADAICRGFRQGAPVCPRRYFSYCMDLVAGAPLLEMVCENGGGSHGPSQSTPEVIELGPQDSPEMMELAALTKPGPFGRRTHELGTYLGIRCEGKLVAMTGERLKVPGYTEVSAVCTHPDHTGKGYARMLMTEIMRGIRDRGETPFLHVRRDNTRAVELYERLGFHTRVMPHFAVLRKV